MEIEIEKQTPVYRKYIIHNQGCAGFCVVEKYTDQFGFQEIWNLELIHVVPERKGFGTELLEYVRKDMKVPMTVCPITDQSRRFFTRHGMILNNGINLLPSLE